MVIWVFVYWEHSEDSENVYTIVFYFLHHTVTLNYNIVNIIIHINCNSHNCSSTVLQRPGVKSSAKMLAFSNIGETIVNVPVISWCVIYKESFSFVLFIMSRIRLFSQFIDSSFGEKKKTEKVKGPKWGLQMSLFCPKLKNIHLKTI